MNSFKSPVLGIGIFLLAGCGLSSCMMYEQDKVRSDSAAHSPMTYDQTAPQPASVAKTSSQGSSSSEPVQKSTPGPKRAAAPQIPVIQ